MLSTTRFSNQELGAGRSWRRRLLLHHTPLALASVAVVALFMTVSSFDTSAYPMGDLFSSTLPKEFDETALSSEHTGPQSQQTVPSEQNGQQGANHTIPQEHGGQQAGPAEDPAGSATTQEHDPEARSAARTSSILSVNFDERRFTVASGYMATAFLGLTLLIGPANLMLRRRRPVSNYLARDVGTWAAGFSVVHVIYGVGLHASITDPIPMFVLNGGVLTNSFGLGNWTGLAATVIVVGLLAISSDFALGKLKVRTWKNLQRSNYVLFTLVALHAFFYGALLRTDSPFTLLLIVSVAAILAGQTAGIWLWRQRYGRRSGQEAA